ncbi:hypothetical protein CDAR_263861 [Caerostris darwini]|uniref:Uncharacterized protein n=1 Tax=Caerostris darwini TaxID=1538125 RepID=A0AAV4RCS4_9ARAC|nr:hypothetical protein CDAR_263861 [Caerostris darwini]
MMWLISLTWQQGPIAHVSGKKSLESVFDTRNQRQGMFPLLGHSVLQYGGRQFICFDSMPLTMFLLFQGRGLSVLLFAFVSLFLQSEAFFIFQAFICRMNGVSSIMARDGKKF